MPEYAPGQIGLVHNTDPSAKVISLFEGGSPITHCVIGLDDGYCIGAEPRGARIRNVWEHDVVAWSAFPLTQSEQRFIVEFARELSGVPYDYLGVWLIGLALLVGEDNAPKWLQRDTESVDRLQCAQLVDYVYTEAGIHLLHDRVPGAVYPSSYVPLFQQKGWLQ
jgi:hypothetical protein